MHAYLLKIVGGYLAHFLEPTMNWFQFSTLLTVVVYRYVLYFLQVGRNGKNIQKYDHLTGPSWIVIAIDIWLSNRTIESLIN